MCGRVRGWAAGVIFLFGALTRPPLFLFCSCVISSVAILLSSAGAWVSTQARERMHANAMADVAISYTHEVVIRATSSAFCTCAQGCCNGEVCDCTKAFGVAPDCLERVGGAYFIKLSRKRTSIRRLTRCLAQADDALDGWEFRVLGRTTIIDDLASEQELALRMAVAKCSREQAVAMNRRWPRTKKYAAKLLAVDKVLTMRPPEVGTVRSCELRVLSRPVKSKGPRAVVLEMNSASFTWLASAIAWQCKYGCVTSSFVQKRNRKRARPSNSHDTDSSDDSAHGDQSSDGDASTLAKPGKPSGGVTPGDQSGDAEGPSRASQAEQDPEEFKADGDIRPPVAVATSPSGERAQVGAATKQQVTLGDMFRRFFGVNQAA